MFIFLFLLIGPIALTMLNLGYHFTNKSKLGLELASYIIGIFLMYTLMSSFPQWYDPIVLGGGGIGMHSFISEEHMLTIECFFFLGLTAYLILKYTNKQLTPLIRVICTGFVLINLFICLVTLIQFSWGCFNNNGYTDTLLYIFYLSLVPLNYVITAGKQLYDEVTYNIDLYADVYYSNRFMGKINSFIAGFKCKGVFTVLATLPILALCICILCLFGQQPDSIIRAFTDTSDWLLSTKISPPPVEYNGHYLCTVSLRGHKELVKPTRMGLRGGKQIIVNRQLCIANAFEELIAEKTPRFHRALRNFYDKYGYPVSKHIKTPICADIVYLIMKPLEWLFLAVLYMCDTKPENRIARQYLPLDKQREFGRKI